MKVIYTNTLPLKPEAGVCYRTTFMGVISGVTSIEIDDDFPNADLVDQAYAFLDTQPVSTATQVGLSPELQQALDDAKADCEKLQAENTDLISDLKAALDAKDQLQAENTALKTKIAELEKAAVKKPTAAELKAAKAAEEAKAVEPLQE